MDEWDEYLRFKNELDEHIDSLIEEFESKEQEENNDG
tara:strand:- start:1279 stop:1389 length:111 start_codon:yes stop_codon:yes gene_type:complete